jgi:hypothetical protein
VNIRKDIKAFGRGQIEWLEALKPDGTKNNSLLVYIRKTNEERFLIIQNLSSSKQEGRLALQPSSTWKELFDNPLDFDKQVESGQFSNSNITLRDITQIRKILKRKLMNIYHLRIEYPG